MDTTRYELPKQGITLLGYVVRRMHKTTWLMKIPSLLADGKTAQALEFVGIYAAASATSFGPAYYQPRFNSLGDVVQENDPTTGALVRAKLEQVSPHYNISYTVFMPDGSLFEGAEEITGTTVGLRGLGMPAPSKFTFTSGAYRAEMTGILTSELALSLIGNTRIRAYGFLNLKDNSGNTGHMELERAGELTTSINGQPTRQLSLLGLQPTEPLAT